MILLFSHAKRSATQFFMASMEIFTFSLILDNPTDIAERTAFRRYLAFVPSFASEYHHHVRLFMID